jgi:toxin HigB-1
MRFHDKHTRLLFNEGVCHRKWRAIEQTAVRKLDLVYNAHALDDLRIPPGNRLEQLHGDRAGKWSIRINDQYRICFAWDGEKTVAIEIVDYH